MQVEMLPFQMLFSGDQTHGNCRAHVLTVGWMVKLLALEHGQLCVCDPGDVHKHVFIEQIPPSVKSPSLLSLMDLHRLQSVPHYILKLMVPLCSRNSTSSEPSTSKKTVSNTLPADATHSFELFRGCDDACCAVLSLACSNSSSPRARHCDHGSFVLRTQGKRAF